MAGFPTNLGDIAAYLDQTGSPADSLSAFDTGSDPSEFGLNDPSFALGDPGLSIPLAPPLDASMMSVSSAANPVSSLSAQTRLAQLLANNPQVSALAASIPGFTSQLEAMLVGGGEVPGLSQLFSFVNGLGGSLGTDLFGNSTAAQEGADFGSLLGPFGSFFGAGIGSLFGGTPRPLKTEETAQAFLQSGDPMMQILGENIAGGVLGPNQSVLSSKGFAGNIAELGDALEVLANKKFPGLNNFITEANGHPVYGIQNPGMRKGVIGGLLTPEQFQSRFGFAIPTGADLRAFANSPFAANLNLSGGFPGIYQNLINAFKQFNAAGGGGTGGPAPGALTGAAATGGSTGSLGGVDLTQLSTVLDQLTNPAQLQSLVAQAVRSAMPRGGGAGAPSSPAYQPPQSKQQDPWGIGTDFGGMG